MVLGLETPALYLRAPKPACSPQAAPTASLVGTTLSCTAARSLALLQLYWPRTAFGPTVHPLPSPSAPTTTLALFLTCLPSSTGFHTATNPPPIPIPPSPLHFTCAPPCPPAGPSAAPPLRPPAPAPPQGNPRPAAVHRDTPGRRQTIAAGPAAQPDGAEGRAAEGQCSSEKDVERTVSGFKRRLARSLHRPPASAAPSRTLWADRAKCSNEHHAGHLHFLAMPLNSR